MEQFIQAEGDGPEWTWEQVAFVKAHPTLVDTVAVKIVEKLDVGIDVLSAEGRRMQHVHLTHLTTALRILFVFLKTHEDDDVKTAKSGPVGVAGVPTLHSAFAADYACERGLKSLLRFGYIEKGQGDEFAHIRLTPKLMAACADAVDIFAAHTQRVMSFDEFLDQARRPVFVPGVQVETLKRD